MFVTCLVSFYLTVFQIFYRYVTVTEDRRPKIEDRRPKIEDRRPETEATRGRPSNNSVIISIILSLEKNLHLEIIFRRIHIYIVESYPDFRLLTRL